MCGIVAISGSTCASSEVLLGLMNLQHRGQDGAGILSLDEGTEAGGKALHFSISKQAGLVSLGELEESVRHKKNSYALGHTRYATVGGDGVEMLQPFLIEKFGIGLAHNGNIVNFLDMEDELARDSALRLSSGRWVLSDSFMLLAQLARTLRWRDWNSSAIFDAVRSVMRKASGSYSVVSMLENGTIFGFRDPHGIRPLFYGKRSGPQRTEYGVASEPVALSYLGFKDVVEVKAGEAFVISPDGKFESALIGSGKEYSPCMFEWVYFSRVESEFGGKSVYDARFALGVELGKTVKAMGLEADVVVPVPETSRVSAIALAEYLGLPFREILVKNRYVNRTFILDNQTSREEAIRRKLFPIASELQGKRCLIVDDSIVRGNTARQITKLVRDSGATDVTLLSACPSIKHPCFYGIDFPDKNELLAGHLNEEEVRQELGADRVIFQSLEGLTNALGSKKLCTGCLTGQYPTDVTIAGRFAAKRKVDREAKPEAEKAVVSRKSK